MLNRIITKINYWLAHRVWKLHPTPDVKILMSKSEQPYYHHVPHIADEKIKASYIESNQYWKHEEYIKLCTGKLFLDPQSGLLLDEQNQIIKDSIIIEHKALYPPALSYKNTKAANTKNIPEIVLFDYHKSTNYFHFYSDVMGKLLMINTQMPELKKLPLIVSEKIYNKKYFQFYLKNKEIASFNWYVQKSNEVIATEKAYLLQPMPYDNKYWQWIKSMARDYIQLQIPNKKIFIDRPRETGRHIENYKEIHELVKGYGYEIATLEGKNIEEQIALFSSASKLISIHGAGLTNLLFCENSTRVLEIMPDERISSHYYWVCEMLGLQYDCILGGKLEQNRLRYPKGRFYLDSMLMRKHLELLEH